MTGYIDLFVLPVPGKKLNEYRLISRAFGKIMKEHGALEYREFKGDDLKAKMGPGFLSAIKLKPGEVLVSSVIGFRSKLHRNQVNKNAMADPRTKKLVEAPMFVDMKRMLYGGFATIVDVRDGRGLRQTSQTRR